MQHADRQFADPRGAEALVTDVRDHGDGGGGGHVWWRVVLWALLAGVLTTVAIRYSLTDGRLSAPADWDDVMYMRYAGERVNELYTRGFGACVGGWMRNTPHSPLSCLMAFGSFLMFGVKDGAPYVMGALVVLGFLFLADWVAGPRRLGVKVLLALYLCTIPMLTRAVTELKPDIMSGLGISAVAAVCVLRPAVGASTRHLVGLGVLCAFSLLSKPTTAPVTLALLGLCGLIGMAKDWALLGRRPGVAAVARSWSYALGSTVVLAGWFFCLHWGYFSYYIRTTLFGEYKETWYLAGGWPAQFKYFVTGRGGVANLAMHVYLIPAVWLVGWAVAASRRDRTAVVRASCLLVMTAACYLMPTMSPAKNAFLASPFFAMVIVTTAFWVGYVARAETSRWGASRMVTAGLVAMVVAGPFLYRWPSMYYGPGGASRAEAGRLHQEVYDVLLRQVKPYPQVTTVMATGPVREVTLAWYATRDRQALTFDRPYSAKVSDYVPYIDKSDFVVAQEDHVAGSVSTMPNEQDGVQSGVLDLMRHRDDYRQLSEFAAADGKKLVLFQRTRWTRGVMAGVRALDGFGPVEGPYPKAEPPMPMFCWGTGVGGRLMLTPERPGPATLLVECRATDRVKAVRVVSGAVVLGTHHFKQPWTSETFEVVMPAAEAGTEVRLEYIGGKKRGPAAGENAVVFTKIELVSGPVMR